MLVKEVVSEFLKAIGEHRSVNTLRFYSGRLVALVHRFGNEDFNAIDPWDIEAYFASVNRWRAEDRRRDGQAPGDPKAPDTVRSNIVAFERLQDFAIKHNFLAAPFDLPPKPDGVARTRLPTPEEVDAIKANSSLSFGLAYEALRTSGAMPGQLARAQISDWDRLNNLIELRNSGDVSAKKKRSIRVGSKLEELLKKSIGNRTDGPIFLTPQGRAWNSNSLSATFRRARHSAKLDPAIVLFSAKHEHDLRRNRAIRAAEEQMDP